MSTRLYDYIITVASASSFRNGNTIIGLTSGTIGYIANVDTTTNNIKVKVNNVFQEFTSGETVVSNHYPIANVSSIQSFTNTDETNTIFTLTGGTIPVANGEYTANNWGAGYIAPPTSELSVYVNGVYQHPENWVYWPIDNKIYFRSGAKPGVSTITVRRETGNVYSQSFAVSNLSIGNTVTSASTSITKVYNSPFIRSKNAFTQPPIVRMLTFYYPGEWYPPNDKGNPSGDGAGYAWPANMPWRVAEVVGDYITDLEYNVTFGTDSYLAYPMEIDGIGTSSDGTIDRVTMRVSNFDNIISNFVENPYLVGNVTSSTTTGYVNGELVRNLDPATIPGINYNQNIVDGYYSSSNSTWSYERAIADGQTWDNLKYDSRDFLGGVVEIKSTLASHLKYWPEYSKLNYIDSLNGNVVQVLNSAPYRVGDTITTPTSTSTPTISAILDENYILLATALTGASTQQPLYIKNIEYDPDAYIKDVFKVTELSALNESFAEFTLTSWLQYFKLQLPKRKYYKNTCQWEYRGPECQYPGPNGGNIPGSIPPLLANVNSINTNNQAAAPDECAKSYLACKLRNNTIHFGGFPGTGRQIPRQ